MSQKKGLLGISMFVLLLGCSPSLKDLKSDKFIRKFAMPTEPGCHTGVWNPEHGQGGGLHKNPHTKAGPDCRPMPDVEMPMCWPWIESDGRISGYYGQGCIDKSFDVPRVN